MYDNTNKISLFKNDKQGNEKRPDYTGKVNVEGKEYTVSMWKRTSKAGQDYISGEIQEFVKRESNESSNRELETSIPF